MQADQLKKTIANLQEQIAQKDKELQALREELDKKDIHIAALDETINNLNTKTSRLTTESSQKTETINAQDKQAQHCLVRIRYQEGVEGAAYHGRW